MLPACVSYLGSRNRDDANSVLRVLVCSGWAASCTRHLLWDAFQYQKLWYFPSVLCAMIDALDLSIFLGGQSNADELQYFISDIESIDRKTVPAARNCRHKGCHGSSSHSPRRLEVAGDFVKYDPQSLKVFVTGICPDCQARPSIQPSHSRQKSAMSARLSDEVFKVPVTGATSNTLVRISARSFWGMSECDEDLFVETPQVICLPAVESSFLLLFTDKPTSIVVDASPDVEVEGPDVGEPSPKRFRSCSTTHPIASMSQSISTMDRFSINLDFVERVGIDVQFVETEEEIRVYLQAKKENTRRE